MAVLNIPNLKQILVMMPQLLSCSVKYKTMMIKEIQLGEVFLKAGF